jgi:hypothetical protein
MTKRLILTNDSSAAASLKLAGRADVLVALERQLIWGQLLSDTDLGIFFGGRKEGEPKFHWLDYAPQWRFEGVDAVGSGLVELCSRFDTIELWIDPRPNDQLQLICLLHHLSPHRESALRLSLVQAYVEMASQRPDVLAKWEIRPVNISDAHFDLASRAWRAFGAATPQDWFGLLATDLSVLPRLRSAVIALLEELPWRATGLGATEMRMLESILEAETPQDVFIRETRDSRRVFDYWDMGALLDGLARRRKPVVSGLKGGPFTMELHDDSERVRRYNKSKISLTPLGYAVLARTDDFVRHNPINRWWGGTKLTNTHLWRWDPDNQVLVAP